MKSNKHVTAFEVDGIMPGETIVDWQPAFREGTTLEGVAILTDKRFVFFGKG